MGFEGGVNTRLLKPPSARNEDATKLNFGPEFSTVKAQPLLLAEAAYLLQVKLDQSNSTGYSTAEHNPILAKSHAYAKRFDRLKTEDNTKAARRLLGDLEVNLHPFETAQLASLMPETAEEAKTIIPSLKDKIDDDVLNDALENLDSLAR